MTIITNWHQSDVLALPKKRFSLNLYQKPHKKIFKVMFNSRSFKSTNVSSSSSSSANDTSPDKPNSILSKSLKSSPFPIMSEILFVFSSYWNTVTSKLLNPPLHPSVDPKIVLTGNFAPVGETAPTECTVVEGELPASLNGAYIRNGPNPQHYPLGPHHLWSGDGMLHSIRLSNGCAIYCSRYVKTYKYKIEHDKGFPIAPNFFTGFYSVSDIYNGFIRMVKAIAEKVNMYESFGLANTSLAFFHGSLFALMEGDLPYKIQLTENGDIKTLQRYDFFGKGPLNMTAHPKMDTETNELFGFELNPKYPYFTYFRFDSTGSNPQKVPLFSMKSLTYVHDFAITENFAIFPDTQLEISLMNLVLCKGIPLNYRPKKASRIGIISRYAMSDSEMRWFQVPGFNAVHILNAWEENNRVVIIVPTISSPDNFMYAMDEFPFYLEKITIDMNTCEVSRTTLSQQNIEMGSINPAYSGKKNRYVYMAIRGSSLKMSGVVKIDLELECEVASRSYGQGCFGGEAYFVAASDVVSGNEDEGFVVSYVHNEITDKSFLLVLDAKSLETVCKIKLPGRVPYGFHGLFVNEEQLQLQHH